MKVKALLKFMQEELTKEDLEKEITFYDYKTCIAHKTPKEVTFVDLSDDKYFDLVFNYNE